MDYQKYKHKLQGLLSLLGSGFFTTVSLVLITSGRLSSISPAVSTFIVGLIQWQILGLTISKVGIDQVIFASVSKDHQIVFDIFKHLRKRVIPLAILVSIIAGLFISPLIAFCMILTIPLDTFSIAIIADSNARGNYNTVALSNVFNYPLFFLSLVFASFFLKLNENVIIILFVFSSCARSLFLVKRWYSICMVQPLTIVDSEISLQMMLQQTLNYSLFRLDQIIASMFIKYPSNMMELQMFFFLSRLPDIISTLSTTIGPIVLPLVYIQYDEKTQISKQYIKRSILFIATSMVIFMPVAWLYSQMWKGPIISLFHLLPFLFNSVLVLPIYVIIYSMLRQGYISSLLFHLLLCFAISLITFAISTIIWPVSWFTILPWLIPMQFFIFIAFSSFISWGKSKVLYTST